MQGQVYSWGDNSFGQLGHGDKRKRQFPTLIELLESKDVYKVAAGKKFSLFCAGRGILLTAGRKLLFDNTNYLTKPKIVEELLTEDIVDICCGDEHAIALTETGEVYVWGKGKNGQLGTGNRNNVSVPVRIQIPTRQLIKRIICGPDSTMLITNSGTILAMGSNKYNKLNLNKRAGFFKEMKKEQNTNAVQGKKQLVDDALLPTAVRPFPRRVVSASLGNNHSGVLLENGHVHLFGLNSYGELGTGSTLPFCDSTRPVKALINKACLHLICGDGFTIVGTLDNEIYFWGLRGGGSEKGENEIIINDKKLTKDELNKLKVKAYRMAKTQEGWQLSATETVNITILHPILVLRLDVCHKSNDVSLNNRSNIGLAGLVCSSKRVFCVVDVANEQIEKPNEEPILSTKQNKTKISRRKSAPDNLSLCNTTETWIRNEMDDAEYIPYKPQKSMKRESITTKQSSQLLESEQKLREEITQLRSQLQEQKSSFHGHEKQMSQLQAKLAELQELLNRYKEIEEPSYLPPVNIPPPEYPGKKSKSSPLRDTLVNKNVTKACNII
uniref:non-specific serine/threonine protein kinase n=2 Tax=Meloidogyne TaxID=189290 RepID=A0A914KP54_MELIC